MKNEKQLIRYHDNSEASFKLECIDVCQECEQTHN